ncbi:hypothetical protein NXW27_00410 [Phocaeicola dorei]|nr:hypothetical protein [Phocaeicola dorei]
MLLGAGLLSVVFNLCNELQYGIWASTCLAALCISTPVFPNGEQLFRHTH